LITTGRFVLKSERIERRHELATMLASTEVTATTAAKPMHRTSPKQLLAEEAP
jgi:hypothetical protein